MAAKIDNERRFAYPEVRALYCMRPSVARRGIYGQTAPGVTETTMRLTSFVSGFGILFAALAMAGQGDNFVVSGDRVNVRAGPNSTTKVLFSVSRDEPAIELARRDGWVQVELPKRRAGGWIHQSLLRERGAPSPPMKVVVEQDAGRATETAQAAAALKSVETSPATTPQPAEPAQLVSPTPKTAELPAIDEPETAPELPKWTESPEIAEASPATEPVVPPADPSVAVEASPATTATTAAATPSVTTTTTSTTSAAPTEPRVPATTTTVPVTTTTAPTTTAPTTTTTTLPTTTTAAVDVENVPATTGDEPASVARFRDSVQYLNERALAAAGIELFTNVRSISGNTVQVLATETWSMVPESGQESYMNTLFSSWATAVGGNQTLTLQIVDPNGQIVMERTGP